MKYILMFSLVFMTSHGFAAKENKASTKMDETIEVLERIRPFSNFLADKFNESLKPRHEDELESYKDCPDLVYFAIGRTMSRYLGIYDESAINSVYEIVRDDNVESLTSLSFDETMSMFKKIGFLKLKSNSKNREMVGVEIANRNLDFKTNLVLGKEFVSPTRMRFISSSSPFQLRYDGKWRMHLNFISEGSLVVPVLGSTVVTDENIELGMYLENDGDTFNSILNRVKGVLTNSFSTASKKFGNTTVKANPKETVTYYNHGDLKSSYIALSGVESCVTSVIGNYCGTGSISHRDGKFAQIIARGPRDLTRQDSADPIRWNFGPNIQIETPTVSSFALNKTGELYRLGTKDPQALLTLKNKTITGPFHVVDEVNHPHTQSYYLSDFSDETDFNFANADSLPVASALVNSKGELFRIRIKNPPLEDPLVTLRGVTYRACKGGEIHGPFAEISLSGHIKSLSVFDRRDRCRTIRFSQNHEMRR